MPNLLRKTLCLCAFLALAGVTQAQVMPPEQEVAAARTAVSRAQARQPVGEAATQLQQAQALLGQAEQLLGKRKTKDAARAAQKAEALADLASANMRRIEARRAVDDKSARNANLRRELLVLPGGGR